PDTAAGTPAAPAKENARLRELPSTERTNTGSSLRPARSTATGVAAGRHRPPEADTSFVSMSTHPPETPSRLLTGRLNASVLPVECGHSPPCSPPLRPPPPPRARPEPRPRPPGPGRRKTRPPRARAPRPPPPTPADPPAPPDHPPPAAPPADPPQDPPPASAA